MTVNYGTIPARLEKLLRDATPQLADARVAVENLANDADMRLMHAWWWEQRFSCRANASGCVVDVSIVARYDEPPLPRDPRVLRLTITAEVFVVGRPSHFEWKDEQSVPLSDCEERGLAPIVLQRLDHAIAHIPDPYRSALAVTPSE